MRGLVPPRGYCVRSITFSGTTLATLGDHNAARCRQQDHRDESLGFEPVCRITNGPEVGTRIVYDEQPLRIQLREEAPNLRFTVRQMAVAVEQVDGAVDEGFETRFKTRFNPRAEP